MLIQHSTNLTICIWIKIPPFQRNARERYLKMSELDVTGDTDYSDVSAMAEELSRASVLFEYNIKGLQPQTKYMIQVQTRNEAGWSPESETFAFSTSQVSAAASPSWSWSPMLTTVLSLTPILVSVLR